MENKPSKKSNLPLKRGFYGNLRYARDFRRDYKAGKYHKFPWKSLLAIVATALYVIMPVDLIPDFIFGFGLIDDAVITALALKAIDIDINNYREWLEQNETEDNRN